MSEMKFIRATIHSFGKWVDTEFDFSNGPLICFYGENESGKSTLRQFLLYMLFGLEPKKRREFQPKNRMEIGGSLKLYDESIGMLTIQRKEDICKCLLEDGKAYDETWWKEHLSGLTKDVYTSIYAFSATDLSHIQTMRKKELSDVLFSVGLTGSTAIYEIERKLMTELDKLYKKRGQKPLLNKQINTTALAFQQLREEQEKEASYHLLVEKLQEKKDTLITMQKEAEALQKENITNEKIIQMLPDIHQLAYVQYELGNMDEVLIFPKDGIERLKALHEAMLPLKSENAFLETKINEYDEKLRTGVEQLLPTESIRKAQEIIDEQPAYEQRSYQLQEKRNQYKVALGQYQAILYDLEWDTNYAQHISLPFHLETAWQEMLDEHKNLYIEKGKLEHEKKLRDENRKQIANELVYLNEQLLPNEQQEYIETRLNQDKETIARQKNDSEWSQWKEKKKKQSTYLLFGSAIVATITCFIAFFGELNQFYIVPFFFIVIGLIHFVFTKQQLQAMTKMVGINHNSSLTEEERQSLHQQLERQEENIAAIRHMKQEQKQMEFQELQYSEALHMLKEKEKEIKIQIDQERERYPFLHDLELAHWPELLKLIRQLQQTERHMDELKTAINQLQLKNDEVDNRLSKFPKANSFEEVKTCLNTQHSLNQFQQQYRQEKKELFDKKKIMDEQMEQLKHDKEQLFSIAEVKTEEEFYEQANLWKKKEGLQQTIAELTQKLQSVFQIEMMKELVSKKPQAIEIETQIEMNQQLLQEKQTCIKECQQEIAQLQVEIMQLERKEDASTTSYRFQIEKDQLTEMQKKWSVLKLAYSALQKAKQTYQDKYMAEVLEWTTTIFAMLTNKRYVQVFPPTETTVFQVEGTDDIRYTVHELSQGTIDQLYVSLRFAIAKVMSDTFCVPLLVDDAFVHFDDQRTYQATKILEEMAVGQQVLFFTCRQTTAEKMDVPKLQGKILKEV